MKITNGLVVVVVCLITCTVGLREAVAQSATCPGADGAWELTTGEYVLTEDVACDSISIGGDATLVVDSVASGAAITITAIDLTVGVDAVITADALGYLCGEGPGAGGSGGISSGGSYGGYGGLGTPGAPAAGQPYGSAFAPNEPGSGGGCVAGLGGRGGGTIRLDVANTLHVEGVISANGGAARSTGLTYTEGGGSGGSIWITTGHLEGAGLIPADGGPGLRNVWRYSGGGSGGRIAVEYVTSTMDPGAFSVSGAGYGGGERGTVVLTDLDDRALTIVGGVDPDAITAGAYNTIVLAGGALLHSSARIEVSELVFADDLFTCGPDVSSLEIAYGVPALGGADLTFVASDSLSFGDVVFEDCAAVYFTESSTSSFLDGRALTTDGRLTLTNPLVGTLTEVALTAEELILDLPPDITLNGSVLTGDLSWSTGNLALVDSQIEGSLDLIASSLSLDATSVLTADALGYLCGNGPEQGKGPGTGGYDGTVGSGGSYGGYGGQGDPYEPSVSPPYGVAFAPLDPGSGGGCVTSGGGPGGGTILIDVATTLYVDGVISANGGLPSISNTHTPGGGSGGSIWIMTEQLGGIGLIQADGGPGLRNFWRYSGGGSGGRIAIEYVTSTFDPANVSVAGQGYRPGDPGTIVTPEQYSSEVHFLLPISFAGEDLLNIDGNSDMDVNDFVIEIGGCAISAGGASQFAAAQVSFIYNGCHVGAGSINNGFFHTVAVPYDEGNLPAITCADTVLGGTAIDSATVRSVVPIEDRGYIQFAVYDNTRYPFDGLGGFIYTDPDVDVTPDANRITECTLSFPEPVLFDTGTFLGDPFLNRQGSGLRGGGDAGSAIEVHAISHPIPAFFTDDADVNVSEYLDNGAPTGVIIPRPGWPPPTERTDIVDAYPRIATDPGGPWYDNPVAANVFVLDAGGDPPPALRIPDRSICAVSGCGTDGNCAQGEICFFGVCQVADVIAGGE